MSIKGHRLHAFIRTGVSLLAAAGIIMAAGCGSSEASGTVVKVALTTSTDEPLWALVNENLKKSGENITVKTVAMKSAVLGNQALAAGDVDLNAQQHYAFLNSEIREKGYKFTVLADSYISPFNIYSDKITKVSQLKKGDKFLVPNDVTNYGRALIVMQEAGIIKLDPKDNDPANGVYPDEKSITSNPKNIQIVPTDRNMIMSSLTDAAAGIANSNAVVDYGKSVEKDAIFSIDPNPKLKINKPWINVIVARTADKNNAVYKKVIKAYRQSNVRTYMKKESKGAEIPTW